MSFKLTYATMFDPPPELHARFESAVERARERLGGRHPLFIAGRDRPAQRHFVKTNPADSAQVLGEFPAASAQDAADAMPAASSAWPSWRVTPPAERAALLRRVPRPIAERVCDMSAAV